MANYRILSSNDLRKHYFSIGKDEASKLNLDKRFTLICHGVEYPDRKIDKSKGSGHVYARKEFFENHHLNVGDRLDFEIDNLTNSITITITHHNGGSKAESSIFQDSSHIIKNKSMQQYDDKKKKNNCTMVIISREEFKRNIDVDLLKYPCLYILLDDINSSNPKHYIGYTNNPIERITTHKSKSKGKKWWQYALVFIYNESVSKNEVIHFDNCDITYSKDEEIHFDICDVAYLEFRALMASPSALHRYKSKRTNSKKADPPYMKPQAQENMIKVFDDIKTLVLKQGLHIFE